MGMMESPISLSLLLMLMLVSSSELLLDSATCASVQVGTFAFGGDLVLIVVDIGGVVVLLVVVV